MKELERIELSYQTLGLVHYVGSGNVEASYNLPSCSDGFLTYRETPEYSKSDTSFYKHVSPLLVQPVNVSKPHIGERRGKEATGSCAVSLPEARFGVHTSSSRVQPRLPSIIWALSTLFSSVGVSSDEAEVVGEGI